MEVFSIVFPATLIITSELERLTLRANNCCRFDADQSCKSGLMLMATETFNRQLIKSDVFQTLTITIKGLFY